jgi:riboflavin kinase / FMN adenylyltransferase
MTMPIAVYNSLDEAKGRFGPCALTIGNFDGVHLCHQELFREVALLSTRHKWTPAALTFNPHPAFIVAPARAPKRIASLEDRIAAMAFCGIQKVLVLPFTVELSQLPPHDFVRQILHQTLDARAVVVGDNFRFGHKQAGDIHLLADLGRELGFATHIEPAVRYRGQVVSSTLVRQAISAGHLHRAWRLLGRPYALTGPVVPGHGIGAKQTVPTLNIAPENEILPKEGVYITRAHDPQDDRAWNAISNIGIRPTFHDDSPLAVETFLLDPFDGRNPARLRVELLHRLRGEKKFESPQALKQQILKDAAQAQAFHRRLSRWVRRLY